MNNHSFVALIMKWWRKRSLVVRVKNDYKKAGRLKLGLEGVLPEEENRLFRQVDSKV